MINFCLSQIFREENQIADTFASLGLSSFDMTWWDSLSEFGDSYFRRDVMRLPNFIFLDW